jgi:uncharacterized membrane protein
MLVVFPLGLLFTAVIFDIIGLVTGQATWRVVAFYDLAAGIVGALVAAVPGFVDYVSVRGRPARTATWHMVVNLTAVAIFSASFVLRTRWAAPWVAPDSSLPAGLAIVAALVLGVGGWLGGHLVYAEAVGVDAAAAGDGRAVPRRRVA